MYLKLQFLNKTILHRLYRKSHSFLLCDFFIFIKFHHKRKVTKELNDFCDLLCFKILLHQPHNQTLQKSK